MTCYFTADDEWDSVWYNDELVATGPYLQQMWLHPFSRSYLIPEAWYAG